MRLLVLFLLGCSVGKHVTDKRPLVPRNISKIYLVTIDQPTLNSNTKHVIKELSVFGKPILHETFFNNKLSLDGGYFMQKSKINNCNFLIVMAFGNNMIHTKLYDVNRNEHIYYDQNQVKGTSYNWSPEEFYRSSAKSVVAYLKGEEYISKY